MNAATSHQAPESAAGFIYQLDRALFWLATCDDQNARVGVETDDDVAVRTDAGLYLVEQDKLSFQDRDQPFQDRGRGLWKSLLIWLGAKLDDTTQLHLVTNRPVPSASLAAAMGRPEKTSADIASCIARLRAAGTQPTEGLESVVRRVCDQSDDRLADVVRRIVLSDATAAVEGGALRSRIVAALHIPGHADADRVVQALFGWMRDVLMAAWRERLPGWISRSAFDRQLDAILRDQRADRTRERATALVPVRAADRAAARGRLFVERLVELDLADDDVILSIDNYVRFSAESLRLNGEGEIVEDEWTGFFSQLSERWSIIRRRHHRNRGDAADAGLGESIFRETADTDYAAPLAGRPTTHFYFTSGGYHRLADEDQIWWHPKHDGRRGTT